MCVIFLVHTSTHLVYLDEGLRFLFKFLRCDGRSFSSRYLLLQKAEFVEGMDLSYRCAKRWGSWNFCPSIYCSTCWRMDHLHDGVLSHSIVLECVEAKPFWSDILFVHVKQFWISSASFRGLEICEFIEDVSEESGSMLVVKLSLLLVADTFTEDVCSSQIEHLVA